jgi:DNA-binding CsgD family transcriptional regulator
MHAPHASQTRQWIAIARTGAPPLLAQAIPIDRLSMKFGGFVGLLALVDPQWCREPTPSALQQVFKLTPAEARLAAGLAKGLDLQQISELHGVSVGTLRVQLKSIFAKTQTKRQAQLAVLLARLFL